MKLLTHNMLTSHVKGVKNGYPLKILVNKLETRPVDFNRVFIQRMLQKINWEAFIAAVDSLNEGVGLPVTSPIAQDLENDDLLKTIHHYLMEVEVIEGNLECPESGRKFPIQEGIPNMLLREDEV